MAELQSKEETSTTTSTTTTTMAPTTTTTMDMVSAKDLVLDKTHNDSNVMETSEAEDKSTTNNVEDEEDGIADEDAMEHMAAAEREVEAALRNGESLAMTDRSADALARLLGVELEGSGLDLGPPPTQVVDAMMRDAMRAHTKLQQQISEQAAILAATNDDKDVANGDDDVIQAP